MKNTLKTVAVATMLATPAIGAEQAFVCEYTSGYGGWTSEAALFIFDEDKGTAQAYDYYIKEMHGGPIDVKLTRASTQRIQFNWEVKAIPSRFRSGDTRLVDVKYRASINMKTKQGSLRATPTVDVLNDTKATGKCRPVQP
ncbi:hypothetical protein BXY66_1142 [Shimia isoporae]|uniref:Uncharacterized protein n=1 Tax=Shimia isoporae TaxID=647720 RepID=A0A4R1NMU8_9RHOB|nr:hypothetical protein [Shimia isoporae]TCL09099.1 hypothetical protein BXY66_1142 [Shimia isoporae]